MAEGGLEGLISGEGEDEAGPASGADPAAMALALDGAKYDPRLAAEARAYLKQQTRLVGIQTEHLHEQRAAQITHLRLRVVLEGFVVAVVAALIVALGVMVWNATQDRGLVVEPFSAPPDLAQKGVTGQVAAKQVLDRLAELQAETTSQRPANSYRNTWSDDVKVEIPETGVSLGEVQRLLNGWLGHETHISGEIFRSATGLTIAARAGEDPAAKVSGPDSDLDGLLQRAAEGVYGQTQPYRYSVYLSHHGRAPEAAQVLDKLTRAPDALERAWAHLGLANLAVDRGDIARSSGEFLLAHTEKPDLIIARADLAINEWRFQHDEDLLRSVRYVRDHHDLLERQGSPGGSFQVLSLLGAYEALITHDAQKARQLRASAGTGVALQERRMLAVVGAYDVVTHDAGDLAREAARGPVARNGLLSLIGLLAVQNHDASGLPLLLEALKADQAEGDTAEDAKREDLYGLALAKATFGDLEGGRALILSTPADCYDCVMGRGQILAMAGDRAGAEHWFAEAIRQGPDVPLALTARGAARLGWGDVAGALADGQAATKISPHDPDALKIWGDALARQGQWPAAREKYDAALTLAPNWRELQKARAAAAAKG
jgi:tetratricopeptide (TPR) repeat protein